jgi:hypothetical protein
MIDPTIEQALAPSKEDWKEPLWAKFRNYAIGFGAALLVVGVLVAAIAYFAEPLAPQTEPVTMTIEPIVRPPAVIQKNKPAAKSISRPADSDAPVVNDSFTTEKPRIDDGFTAEFDKQVLNFESKL